MPYSHSHAYSRHIYGKCALTEPQLQAVNAILRPQCQGLMLVHTMGTGKTLTTIAMIDHLINNGDTTRDVVAYIVTRPKLCEAFERQIQDAGVDETKYLVLPYSNFVRLYKRLDPSVYVIDSTNSENVCRDETYAEDLLKDVYLVIDEAHNARTPGTDLARALQWMAPFCNKVILLTGTPIVNSPGDISILLNALQTRVSFPQSPKDFNAKYISDMGHGNITLQNQDILEDAIGGLISYYCPNPGRVVADGLFPVVVHHYEDVPMSELQTRIYNDLEQEYLTPESRILLDRVPSLSSSDELFECAATTSSPSPLSTEGGAADESDDVTGTRKPNAKLNLPQQRRGRPRLNTSTRHLANAATFALNCFLNKTRQISNSAHQWTSLEPVSEKHRAIVREIVQGAKPAVVFSSFVKSGLDPLIAYMQTLDPPLRLATIKGSSTTRDVANTVARFNNRLVDVLFLSAAAGEGIDLKNTRQIHVMEPHWNNARIEQAIGRAVRYRSHIELPLDEQRVDVWHWISVRPQEDVVMDGSMANLLLANQQIPTADQYLAKVARYKQQITEMFMAFLADNSIQKTYSISLDIGAQTELVR